MLEEMCKAYWYILVLIGIAVSLAHNHEKVTYKYTKEKTGLQIIVTVNDLFAVKASSFVIPTNTGFFTDMRGDFISPHSVQGAFQLKYFKNNLKALDAKLRQNRPGFAQKHQVGDVVKVDHRNKHYYFLAICDINESGKPVNQSTQNISMALRGLIKYITRRGHCDVLAMPLIGTGKAAIRGATIAKDYLDGRIDPKRIECLFGNLEIQD